MANDCFAYKRKYRDDGTYYTTKSFYCCAVKDQDSKRFQRNGECGTLDCPFYKPQGKEHFKRLGGVLRDPSPVYYD